MEITRTVPSCPMVHPSHLPQIPNFYGGDQRDGDTFEDWFDNFEAVANIAGWDWNFKLVHLTMALRGNAKSFYRSCTPVQKSSYPQLVDALKKRFTPMKLTAFQTQMFHSRRQGATESVDDFVQELRWLHSKAYSAAISGSPEAEKVGQIVLVNQFVSGLRPELQAKVVGVEGSMDELVTKARFEEAKIKELSGRGPGSSQKEIYAPRGHYGGHGNQWRQVQTLPTPSVQQIPPRQGKSVKYQQGKRNVKCFQCGLEGHIQNNCPYQRSQSKGSELRAKPQVKNITTQKSSEVSGTKKQEEIQELRERLLHAKLTEAIESFRAVNLVVPAVEGPRLGPTVYAPVRVNGVTTDALVDTGSPTTIISLEFALKVLHRNRPKGQTYFEWKKLVREKFKDPDITLKNYGGHQLYFIGQIELTLYQGDRHLTSTLLVKKDAPNNLLVGTDVQPLLGLSVVTKDDDGGMTDLFTGQRTLPLRTGCHQQTNTEENQKSKTHSVPMSKRSPDTTSQPGSGSSGSPVELEVRLLQAVKVPAGRQKLV